MCAVLFGSLGEWVLCVVWDIGGNGCREVGGRACPVLFGSLREWVQKGWGGLSCVQRFENDPEGRLDSLGPFISHVYHIKLNKVVLLQKQCHD